MPEAQGDLDRFPYPGDQVVAEARDDAMVKDGLERLEASGFSRDLVDVLSGSEGAGKIDAEGAGHGLAGRFKRRLQDVLGDESAAAREYSEHLQQGGRVVAVTVNDRDEAKRASDVLRDGGFEAIRYFSSTTVERF